MAIVGIGNCASALVQGVYYYRNVDDDADVPGLMHVNFGGYHIRDIEFVAAFEVNRLKIGKDLSEAIFTEPNCCYRISDVPHLGVEVLPGPILDGVAPHMREPFYTYDESDVKPVDVVEVLKETKADMLINFLPVGSYEGTRFYAKACLEAGCAFVNCIPEFIASDPDWARRFEERGLPIAGDDIKSQVGATIVHRALVDLLVAVTAAYVLRNAQALVLGYVAADLTRLAVSYLVHPFRPRIRFDWSKAAELFDYGVWVLLFDMTVFAGVNAAGIAIGKIVGATALGYFQMAERIPNVVVRGLGLSLSNVAFPAYAELQASVGRLREAYKRIAGVSATLLMPAAVGIISIGHDFTRIFLGSKWTPMVPPLLILSAAGVATGIVWTGRPAFMGGGRPQVVFQTQLARAATVLLFIYPLSSRWGIVGAALAVVLSSISALAVTFVNLRRHFRISWEDMGLMFTPPLAASLCMAGVIRALRALTISLLPGQHLWDVLWLVCIILAVKS